MFEMSLIWRLSSTALIYFMSEVFKLSFTAHYWSVSWKFVKLGSVEVGPRGKLSHYLEHLLDRNRKSLKTTALYCFAQYLTFLFNGKCDDFRKILIFKKVDLKYDLIWSLFLTSIQIRNQCMYCSTTLSFGQLLNNTYLFECYI
jgi:hypothetical protein